MHYIDEGAGEIILFVPGTFSWSFDFWKVIKPLSKHYRCIAIDHIGSGLSDQPEEHDYSAKAHSNALEHFILDMGLKDITMVVHNLGGPIGLHVAMRHAGLIKKMIIMNSWLWNCATDPVFIKLSKTLRNPFQIFMYRYLNYPPKAVLHVLEKRRKPGHNGQLVKQQEKAEYRSIAIKSAKALLEEQEWYEQLWSERTKISKKPVLFIWGEKDRFTSNAHLRKFISGFENNMVHVIKSSGHFPHEEAPLQVAVSIWTWLSQSKQAENELIRG